ncbi:hypothetical protein HHI36_018696 [Cryptolaemus montrouzieri]|uniref:Uncharacterized protein n=1 Tax=Cryptolaemus montrouzieri TaxID=559131 RepID=A0ABD2P0S2_9CUCU
MVYRGGKRFSKGKKRSIFEIQKYEDSDRTQKIRGGTEQSEQTNQGDKERTLEKISEENMEYASSKEKPVNEYVQLNQVSAKQGEQYLTELYNNEENENDS